MVHLTQRLAERGIDISPSQLVGLARECRQDTAVILTRCQMHLVSDGYIGSNGDLVILIVRHQYPITIMFRRSNQPLTAQALKVDEVIDRSH